jgi:hypothetical protein
MTRRWNEETWRCDNCGVHATVERMHDPMLKPKMPEGWYEINNDKGEEWSFCAECWAAFPSKPLPKSEAAMHEDHIKALFSKHRRV